MKNLLLLLLFTVSSCCNETETIYTLAKHEKDLIPYKLQDVVKWTDNNSTIHTGIITQMKDEYIIFDELCNTTKINELSCFIKINNEEYHIMLSKKDHNEKTNLSISQITENQIHNLSFINNITTDSFKNITFNGEVFDNAIKLESYNKSTLIYSKTSGIEFILFNDGSWYKRVE